MRGKPKSQHTCCGLPLTFVPAAGSRTSRIQHLGQDHGYSMYAGCRVLLCRKCVKRHIWALRIGDAHLHTFHSQSAVPVAACVSCSHVPLLTIYSLLFVDMPTFWPIVNWLLPSDIRHCILLCCPSLTWSEPCRSSTGDIVWLKWLVERVWSSTLAWRSRLEEREQGETTVGSLERTPL
jgi:hypothetical protein